MKERRYKTFKIREQDIFNVLLDPIHGKVSRLLIKELIGIPYSIDHLVYNSLQACWDVILYSETFEIVKDLEYPPELIATTEIIDLGSCVWKETSGNVDALPVFSYNINAEWPISNDKFISPSEPFKKDVKEQVSSGNNPFDKDWT